MAVLTKNKIPSGHWYRTDGMPVHRLPTADGRGERPTTIRDAKRLGLYPTLPHPTSVCTHTGGAPASSESVPDVPSREMPSLEAVLARAQRIGLAEWKARDWFNEMEGCGWKDYAGRDIRRWEAVLKRVAVKWRADGSPTSPPARNPEPSARTPNRRAPIDWSKGFFGEQTPKPTST
jgi:hypothetical protein